MADVKIEEAIFYLRGERDLLVGIEAGYDEDSCVVPVDRTLAVHSDNGASAKIVKPDSARRNSGYSGHSTVCLSGVPIGVTAGCVRACRTTSR